MKALVVVPPVQDLYFTPRRAASLGAEAVRREMLASGLDAEIVDFARGARPTSLPLPAALDHLKPFLLAGERGPVSYFRGYRRFGPSSEKCAQSLRGHKPDLCLFTCFAYCYAAETIDLARATARCMPDVPLLIGGHGAAVLPEYFSSVRHPDDDGRSLFDLVVVGEVEGRGREILDSRGLLDLRKSAPALGAHPVSRVAMSQEGRRWVSVSLSRGCPLGCPFCSNHLCHGVTYRAPDLANAMAEIDRLKEIGIPGQALHLNIEDDNILLSPDLFFAFLEETQRRMPGTTFSAENGLDYRLLDPPKVNRLGSLGFTHLNLSLGDAEQGSRSRGDLAAIVGAADSTDLPVTTHFICGMSGDTPNGMVEILCFLDGLSTRIGISLFYPVPGLAGFEDPHAMAHVPPCRMAGSSAWPWTGALSTSEMVTAFRLARWSNARKSLGVDPGRDAMRKLVARSLLSKRLHTWVRAGRALTVTSVPELDQTMMTSFFSGIRQ